MTTQSAAGARFPALPVASAGIAAVAGLALLALEQPAPGALACLAGLAVSVPLWLREMTLRERQWQTRISGALAEQAAQAAANKRKTPDLSRLQADWFPGMGQQLMVARNQVESAANDVGHALDQVRQHLEGVARQAAEAADAMGSSGSGVAQDVGSRLNSMLDSIHQSLSEKVAMFNEVRGFVSATDELARMASSVEELAAKTNLLALNAAIEAARAGEEGRGFSIVADEVRKLSMLSAETGQQIRQRVADISAAARRAGEGADRMQGSDTALLQHAQQTVGDVVDSFSRAAQPLERSAREMAGQAGQMVQEVDQAQSALGFQSDVSAVLQAMDNSLQALCGQVAAGQDIDVGSLMRPLSDRTAMPVHRTSAAASRRPAAAVPTARPAAAPAGGSNGGVDITFF